MGLDRTVFRKGQLGALSLALRQGEKELHIQRMEKTKGNAPSRFIRLLIFAKWSFVASSMQSCLIT